jgi:Arc/MetJ family transcription regulator
MGRTNIVLDDKLVEECRRLTGIKTTRALVDYSLNELRRRKKQLRLLQLQGVQWDGNLAAMRESRF